jgi:hypothetical protein
VTGAGAARAGAASVSEALSPVPVRRPAALPAKSGSMTCVLERRLKPRKNTLGDHVFGKPNIHIARDQPTTVDIHLIH